MQVLDVGVRNELVLEHQAMVRRIARQLARRYPQCVSLDDLVGIGTLGLIDAIDRYDPRVGASFANYARIRVKGAIVDALRQDDWVPRSVRRRARALEEARARMAEQLRREPTIEEVAAELGIPAADLGHYARDAAVYGTVSMEEPRGEGQNRVADTLESPEQSPVDVAQRQSVRDRVSEAVAALPERDRLLVRLYYDEGLSMKEVGHVLGVTESRVSQLHTRACKRLRETLADVVG